MTVVTLTAAEIGDFFLEMHKIKAETVDKAKKNTNSLNIEKIKGDPDRIHREVLRLCKKAFDAFRSKIALTYTDPKYSDLIVLYVSKETGYFVAPYFLREDLQQLILEKIKMHKNQKKI